MTIEIEFTRSAERDILDASIAWRTHHSSAPGLLDDELNAALERIQLFPEIAPLTLLRRFKDARRMVLQESGHLLIYRNVTKKRVRVLALLIARKTTERP